MCCQEPPERLRDEASEQYQAAIEGKPLGRGWTGHADLPFDLSKARHATLFPGERMFDLEGMNSSERKKNKHYFMSTFTQYASSIPRKGRDDRLAAGFPKYELAELVGKLGTGPALFGPMNTMVGVGDIIYVSDPAAILPFATGMSVVGCSIPDMAYQLKQIPPGEVTFVVETTKRLDFDALPTHYASQLKPDLVNFINLAADSSVHFWADNNFNLRVTPCFKPWVDTDVVDLKDAMKPQLRDWGTWKHSKEDFPCSEPLKQHITPITAEHMMVVECIALIPKKVNSDYPYDRYGGKLKVYGRYEATGGPRTLKETHFCITIDSPCQISSW